MTELAAQLRAAHERFGIAVAPHRPALHRYCARMTGSVFDGEDVVQDVLAHAFQRLALEADEVALRPLLFTIAHHRCVDLLRRRAAVAFDELDDAAAAPTDVAVDDRDLARRAFTRLVLALPPRERTAVILKEVLDHSLDDIAGVLDTSVGAVKAALHRGRAKLAAASLESLAAPSSPAVTPPTQALYVEAFNRRDWPALLGLLAHDVRVELVGHVHRRGHDDIARNYLGTYDKAAFEWRVQEATVDGERVLVCRRRDGDAWTTRHAIRLRWQDGRVEYVRDYAHVAYLLGDADVVVAP
jgi:RNA polymerase sigma-70 factor (ECF subfamily)